jgi:hypothetical protein
MENPTEIKYCRREVGEPGRLCCRAIERKTSLNWCPACLSRLPLWPVITPPEAFDESKRYVQGVK